MLRRVPHTPLMLSSCARKYSLWDFLPRVKTTPKRKIQAPPPPLSTPKYLDVRGRCTLEYVEISPLEETLQGRKMPVTIVLMHGAPGSYNDFRHLIPVLRQPHMRILGINMPGYAGSKVAKEHYLEDISALPTAGLTLEATKMLCDGQDNVFLVGHSFGAHTVINMAALHATEMQNNALKIRGIVLLAPAGCRPHKVLRPRESEMVVNLLRSGNPMISMLISHLIKSIYTRVLGFPSDALPGHYTAGLVRAGTTDFGVIRDQVGMLRDLKMPSLVAWSQNDEFMKKEIPVELAKCCYPGPRLAFAGGGHNVQKTRAEQIANAMSTWIEEVLNEDGETQVQRTQELP